MRRDDLRLLVAAGVLFIELMDATIILTALPAMAASIDVSASVMSIGVTTYAMAVAVSIPASGWAADALGGRRLLLCALALFVASSVLCALAPRLEVLVIGRLLQGTAGAMMVPVARLLVLGSVEPSQMMRTIAFLTWPALLAPLVAPFIGGVVTEYIGWRWIFLLNVPLGALAFASVLALFNAADWRRRSRKFDSVGFLLAASSAGGLVWTLDLGVRGDRTWIVSLAAVFCATLLLVFHLRRTPEPILDARLFRIPTFAAAAAHSGALMRTAINATPFLIPLMFQIAFGMSAAEAGAMLGVYMAGNIAIKPATTSILRRWSFRDVLSANGIVGSALLFALAFCGEATPVIVLSGLLFAAGMSRSLNFTATNTLTFADVPPNDRNDASTLASVLQQMAFSVGVGSAACLLAVFKGLRDSRDLVYGDFRLALVAVALVMLVSAMGYRLSVAQNAGDNVRL